MKKFLKVIGYILLMIVAIFAGEFMRDIGLEDSFTTYVIMALFAVVAYYVISLQEKVELLQHDLKKLKGKVESMKMDLRVQNK